MIAIITRAMFSGSEDAPLRPINNQELVNWKSNTIPRRSRMLTTAAAIYTMTEVLLEYYDITSKTRRDEEKLEQGMKFMKEFWNKTMSEVNAFKDYQKYISDGNSLEAYRKKNLLLKPVTQMALSQAVIIKELNSIENDELRRGYYLGIINQRGVHWIDPEGKPELELAEDYENRANIAESRGYSRYADILRGVADEFKREARRNALRARNENDDIE